MLTFLSLRLIQVYVDREDSPEGVMNTLDAVVLQHRVAEQEGTIVDLRERIAEMEIAMISTGILKPTYEYDTKYTVLISCTYKLTESGRLADMDDIEDRAKAELGTNTKRLELTLLALNEAKTEIADLREKNLELEKSLIESRMPSISPFWVEPPLGRSMRRVISQDDKNNGEEYSSGETDGEEDYTNERIEELRSVVRERYNRYPIELNPNTKLNCKTIFRTAQLKVLTQTIESLQLSAGSGESTPHDLIKRIVELTAELSSQTASSGLAERKVLELEADRMKKSKVSSKLLNFSF